MRQVAPRPPGRENAAIDEVSDPHHYTECPINRPLLTFVGKEGLAVRVRKRACASPWNRGFLADRLVRAGAIGADLEPFVDLETVWKRE